MQNKTFGRSALAVLAGVMALMILAGCATPPLCAARRKKKKEKHEAISPNDPTARLFELLNDSFAGKLSDLYVLANVYAEPSDASQQYQRVLKVDYNKDLYFGRLVIHVRSVGKMTPEQLAIYTPEQIYQFGVNDGQIFDKTAPGPFGAETGDLFLSATANGPLKTAEITDAISQEYDTLVTQYILPAVQKQQKQQAAGRGEAAETGGGVVLEPPG